MAGPPRAGAGACWERAYRCLANQSTTADDCSSRSASEVRQDRHPVPCPLGRLRCHETCPPIPLAADIGARPAVPPCSFTWPERHGGHAAPWGPLGSWRAALEDLESRTAPVPSGSCPQRRAPVPASTCRRPARSWVSRCGGRRRNSMRGTGATAPSHEHGEQGRELHIVPCAALLPAAARHPPPWCTPPLQVLDVGQVVAGNFCGAILAYFGADVIKVGLNFKFGQGVTGSDGTGIFIWGRPSASTRGDLGPALRALSASSLNLQRHQDGRERHPPIQLCALNCGIEERHPHNLAVVFPAGRASGAWRCPASPAHGRCLGHQPVVAVIREFDIKVHLLSVLEQALAPGRLRRMTAGCCSHMLQSWPGSAALLYTADTTTGARGRALPSRALASGPALTYTPTHLHAQKVFPPPRPFPPPHPTPPARAATGAA